MQLSYLIKPGESAEQLSMRRRLAEKLMEEGTSYAPIQHWTQGLARMANAAMGGWEMHKADAADKAEREQANSLLSSLIPSLAGGGASSAGEMAAPSASPAPASPAQGSFAAAGRDYAPDGPMDALSLIRKEEGFAPTAKWDVRQYSGGYGSKAAAGETFTREKAEEYLRRDAAPAIAWVEKNVPNATPQQKSALVSFGYNLGVDDLDKLKPDIDAGDWQRVGARMLSFNKAATGPGGALVEMPGLTSRRQREAALLGGGGAAPVAGPAQPAAGSNRLSIATQLMQNPRTAQLGQAILTQELTREKAAPKRTVVSPGSALVDEATGRELYRAPAEDASTKAEQSAMGKARGEAKMALPGAVSGGEETISLLERLRTHRGLDQGTGVTSIVANRIPGTAGYAFEQLRKQAQGTAFLTAIGQMRGTGAISNVEGEAATQAVARMASAQSKEDFLEALDDYERVVRKGVASAYRQAGQEPPEGLLKAPAPRRDPDQPKPVKTQTISPQTGQAIGDAPAGMPDGTVLKSASRTLIVQGGKLVQQDGAQAPTAQPEAPAAPAQPQTAFKGPWTSDRRALIASPTPEAKAAFDRFYGQGKADQVLGAEEAAQRPAKPYYGRGSYILNQR
jgi:GH24 family phage-related lysozyme (muramidase)